jgi:hypothetical protein
MNLHFIFFLLDILVWFIIAAVFCSQIYINKSNRFKLSKTTMVSVFILSLLSGLFSVLVNGIPDIGFSMNSFVFAFIACFGVVFYTQIKQNKLILKYNK